MREVSNKQAAVAVAAAAQIGIVAARAGEGRVASAAARCTACARTYVRLAIHTYYMYVGKHFSRSPRATCATHTTCHMRMRAIKLIAMNHRLPRLRLATARTKRNTSAELKQTNNASGVAKIRSRKLVHFALPK